MLGRIMTLLYILPLEITHDIRKNDHVSSWQGVDICQLNQKSTKRQAAGHSGERFFLIRLFEAGRSTCGWRLLVAALIKTPEEVKSAFACHRRWPLLLPPIPSLMSEPASSGWDTQSLDSATIQFLASLLWSMYCWLPRSHHGIQSNKSLPSYMHSVRSVPPENPDVLKMDPNTVHILWLLLCMGSPVLHTDFCLLGVFFLESSRSVTLLSALSFFLLLSWSCQVLSLCMCSHAK